MRRVVQDDEPTLDAKVQQTIDELELPECGCKLKQRECHCPGCERGDGCDYGPSFEPCEHMRAADHGLSIAQWTELLRSFAPEHYNDRPPPHAPAESIMRRRPRVSILARRRADGFGLWHERDYWRMEPNWLAITLIFTANQRPVDADLKDIQPDKDDDDPEPVPTMKEWLPTDPVVLWLKARGLLNGFEPAISQPQHWPHPGLNMSRADGEPFGIEQRHMDVPKKSSNKGAA